DACRMKRSVTSPSIWARRSGATFATAASISLVLIAGAMDRAASFAAPSSRDLPHELLAGVRGEIELGGGLRPIEQEALHLRAPGGAQQFKLFCGLHALARGIELERAAEPCHRADDRRAVRPVGELGHERLVDLDLVERKHAQIAERRVAGAEIVEHDVNAARLELMEDREAFRIVLQQH